MFILLFASVFIVRVTDLQKQINQYIADVRLADETLQNAINYSHVNPKAIKQPLVFSVYNQGLKIPRVVSIWFYERIVDSESVNEEKNMVYIESNQVDITFLITFFLSLFILLISYDCVNGEKQVGTLRILMTYPLKRQSFILKKILGVFIFVAFTFTIPYLLSLVTLIFIYADMLTTGFFLSAFFYWFFVLLFVFFFTLLGVFISTCSTSPNRSLVYSLLVWILFSIVLPISWDYIFSPSLYKDKLDELERNYQDKRRLAINIIDDDIPEDADPYRAGGWYVDGFLYNTRFFATRDSHEQRNRFQKYVYEKHYPISRTAEQTKDEVYRKQIEVDSVKDWVFFYNPIVLFHSLAGFIAGNSRLDQLIFLQEARGIRDELVNLGISEGWLLDARFHRIYKEEYDLKSWAELWEEYGDSSKIGEFAWYTQTISEKYELELPYIRAYEQPNYTFGEVFSRVFVYLVMFVGCILVLWVMTWRQFMRYDVR